MACNGIPLFVCSLDRAIERSHFGEIATREAPEVFHDAARFVHRIRGAPDRTTDLLQVVRELVEPRIQLCEPLATTRGEEQVRRDATETRAYRYTDQYSTRLSHCRSPAIDPHVWLDRSSFSATCRSPRFQLCHVKLLNALTPELAKRTGSWPY